MDLGILCATLQVHNFYQDWCTVSVPSQYSTEFSAHANLIIMIGFYSLVPDFLGQLLFPNGFHLLI